MVYDPSRLDGPSDRKKDRPKGPIPGGGTNPFAHKAKAKATQKTKVAKKPVKRTRRGA